MLPNNIKDKDSNSNNHNNNAVLRALNRIHASGAFMGLVGSGLSRQGSQGSVLSRGGGSVPSKGVSIHSKQRVGVSNGEAMSVHSRGGSVQSRGGSLQSRRIGAHSRALSMGQLSQGAASNKGSAHSSFRSSIQAMMTTSNAISKNNHQNNHQNNQQHNTRGYHRVRPSQRANVPSNVHRWGA